MANIRVLDLAKELKADVAEVQRIALVCGIKLSGPTTMLSDEEKALVVGSFNKKGDVPNHKPGGKTLTLNRPILTGGQRGAPSSDGRGRTVKVEVRRRRQARPASVAPTLKAPESADVEKNAGSVASAPKVEPARHKSAASSGSAARDVNRQAQGRKPGDSEKKSSRGPRTTIRRGLTPAQIAAAKVPRKNVKEIEQSIRNDRAANRAGAPGSRRPAGARDPRRPSTMGAPARRSPSVAVADAPKFPQRKRIGGQAKPKRMMSPAERAARRDYEMKRHAGPMTEEQEERMARLAGKSRKGKKDDEFDIPFVIRDVKITETIVVSELASRMAIKGAEVVKKLFSMGMTATVNESIDADTAQLIVEEFGHRFKRLDEDSVEDKLLDADTSSEDEGLLPRPPVVTVMGHVDHGKTSLLDRIRQSQVADAEAGGITQHIGAYMVKLKSGDGRVIFLDTPGHEAFTSLRARGSKITDVVVLVVAADDGVKPQSVEAINHAKAAGVPIIVAVNKMDKEGADLEKVRSQLSEHEIISEEWGGDTPFVPVSAHTGEGVDDLLEMLSLQTELLELKANPDKPGRGVIIEAQLDRGRGPIATVLVQSGTFHQGDIVVAGTVMGRVRALVDENGAQHRTAGPSIPAEILGMEHVPEAGQIITVVDDERHAKELISFRKDKLRNAGESVAAATNFDELFAQAGSDHRNLNVVIKADVSGSVDAIAQALSKVGNEDVSVKVVHKAIGGINESDVMLASASGAYVIGFNVRPEAKAKKLAAAEKVDVYFYKVIYDAIDDATKLLTGMLNPDVVEEVIGSADVREVFAVPKLGSVAGCFVTDGYITRDASVRVLRDSTLVYEGKLASLRRFKDDVKEVKSGYECGIGVEKFNDIKPGDQLEFFTMKEEAASL